MKPIPPFPGLMENIFGRDIFDLVGNNGHMGSLPGVNIKETKDGFNIEVAAPGLKKQHFKLNLDKMQLGIFAEVSNEGGDKDGDYTRREFNYSSFKRTFSLPQSADTNGISAKYENGILMVEVPKKEEAKDKPARTIEIV